MVLLALLLSVIFAALTLGWLLLMMGMFALRHEFEIAARSPSLMIVTHATLIVSTGVVFVQWIMQSLGNSIPCCIVYAQLYSVQGLGVPPYVIRVVRLVIAYNREYRAKYSRFVKWNQLKVMWAAVAVGCLLRGALFFGQRPEHYSSDARDCYYADDTSFVAVCLLFSGPPLLFFSRSLLKVNDSFKIGEELSRTVGGCSLLAGINNAIVTLVGVEVIPDTPRVHLLVEAIVILFGLYAAVLGLLIPMKRAHHLSRGGWFKAIIPVEDGVNEESLSSADSVLALATAGGEMAEEFALFCRENLCMESWDFLVDVVRYRDTKCSLDDQFANFTEIFHQYMLPTSPDEVNISSDMRKRISPFQSRDAFTQLDVDARSTIFHEAFHEIMLMLEQNLLEKFQRHVGLRQALANQRSNPAQRSSAAFSPLLGMMHIEAILRRAAAGDPGLLEILRASAMSERATEQKERLRTSTTEKERREVRVRG